MATMAANHVSVAMAQVETTSLLRLQSLLFSNYIILSHYDQVLFFSVYLYTLHFYKNADRILFNSHENKWPTLLAMLKLPAAPL